MEDVSLNSESLYDDETEEFNIEGDCAMTEFVGQNGAIQGENPVPPAVGMEFESFDDVYYFYNYYAKRQGFGVRVSNTWYRKSKERYRGKLSCSSSAGFKKKSDANRPRPETRTGCPAMVKFRLMENKRWRIIEIELEHNHLISPTSGKFYKSHKTLGLGTKTSLQLENPEEIQKIKLFRTVVIDAEDNDDFYADEVDFGNCFEQANQLKLKLGDAQAIYHMFCQLQLSNPIFFYVMDLNERGHLGNVFWADAKSRVAYYHFGDVLAIDTTCLTSKYEVPLVVFTGVNHHGQSVCLGCGLISGDTEDSYIWLFRAWLTYMLGRPPQVIVIDPCRSLETAVSDVFPRAFHCLSLSCFMKKVPEELGGIHGYEDVNLAFIKAMYYSLRADEFELAWEDMVHTYGLMDHKWLQTLYEDRKRWVPAYLKDTLLAGMFLVKQSEDISSLFEGHIHQSMPSKEFLDNYGQALQKIQEREALANLECRKSTPIILSRFCFELQLSKLYTNNIFKKFQVEIEGMFSCLSTRKVGVDGPIVVYVVEEHAENRRDTREYEVVYNASVAEVVCGCGLFNFKGYLCRHALKVLNLNGIEEIPPHYILSHWRKDIHCNHALDQSCGGIDVNNPVHRHDDLHKRVVQFVEEGRKSCSRYKFALQSLDEILNKVRLVEDQPPHNIQDGCLILLLAEVIAAAFRTLEMLVPWC